MKCIFLAVSFLLASSVYGQNPQLTSTAIDLTTAATTTILSLSSTSGFVSSISCSTAAVAGGSPWPTLYLSLSVDNASETDFTIFSSDNEWYTDVLPFWSPHYGSGDMPLFGELPNDSFVLPLNMPFSSSLQIKAHVTTATSTSGSLLCNVLSGY
jgi:hypothetical protein